MNLSNEIEKDLHRGQTGGWPNRRREGGLDWEYEIAKANYCIYVTHTHTHTHIYIYIYIYSVIHI